MHDALTINKETNRWQVGSTELPTGYCLLALAKGQAKLLPPLGALARIRHGRS